MMARVVMVMKSESPRAGDRIEFGSDRYTDKGPSSGEIVGAKITVDGLYVKVRHSDGEESFSWDDLHAERRGDGWFVKSHPAIFPGPASGAEAKSGNYAKRKLAWHGLTISIENEAGTVRRGTGPGGVAWETRMIFDYGYINRTEGVDGDHVDVYVGPNPDATMVYVIHQRKSGDWSRYDEDKVLIDFDCEESARAAYLAQYNDPRFLGPITAMPVAEFVGKVRLTKEKPAVIKAVLILKAAPTVTEPAAELVKEHKRLVAVLRSPSHADDAVEADRQEDELEEYEKISEGKKRAASS